MQKKNIFKALAAAMLMPAMLLTTACSNQDDVANINNEPTVNKGYALPVTVNVTRQGDATTRATYNDNGDRTGSLAFSAGDKLFVNGNDNSVGGAGQFAGTLDYVPATGKFSGTITTENSYSGTADALFTAASGGYYPDRYVYATLLPNGYDANSFLYVDNHNSPDIAYDDDANARFNNAFVASETAKATGVEQLSFEKAGNYNSGFALAPLCAVLNFTISGLEAGAKDVTLWIHHGSDYTVTGSVPPNASGVATFAIGVPVCANIKEGSNNLTVGSSNFTLPSSPTFAAGKIYNITRSAAPAPAYTMAAAATAEDIGKVVCAAGHLHLAKTAVPTGCTAVGILGKVTETGHGLILALQDATSQSWNTINGWDTYPGTTLKLLPAGALGSLTSYTTLGSTTVSNWCLAQKSDYEAIFINLGSTKYDVDGYTYDANVNAYITTGVGGTPISGSGVYWSATEDGSNVWAFSSNFWNRSGKDTNRSLRPVLGF